MVASTERCESGRTDVVQGPPALLVSSRGTHPRRWSRLTSNNNKISKVTLSVTRFDSRGTFGRARSFDDQIFELTLRPPKNELDTGFQAQMPSIHTGLISQSDSRACIEKTIGAVVLEVVKKMVLPGPFGT